MSEIEPDIILAIEGVGVAPDTVAARDLAALLAAMETAIRWAFSSGESHHPVMALVQIKPGSNRLGCRVPQDARRGFRMLPEAIVSKKFDELHEKSHAALHRVYELAVKRGWVIAIEGTDRLEFPTVRIGEKNPVPARKPRVVRGATTVFGEVLTLGGDDKQSVRLLLTTGEKLSIPITEDMVFALRNSLKEMVGLRGTATWAASDWRLLHFDVAEVLPFKRGPVKETLEKLRELSRGVYEGINADEYVDELRGKS